VHSEVDEEEQEEEQEDQNSGQDESDYESEMQEEQEDDKDCESEVQDEEQQEVREDSEIEVINITGDYSDFHYNETKSKKRIRDTQSDLLIQPSSRLRIEYQVVYKHSIHDNLSLPSKPTLQTLKREVQELKENIVLLRSSIESKLQEMSEKQELEFDRLCWHIAYRDRKQILGSVRVCYLLLLILLIQGF